MGLISSLFDPLLIFADYLWLKEIGTGVLVLELSCLQLLSLFLVNFILEIRLLGKSIKNFLSIW